MIELIRDSMNGRSGEPAALGLPTVGNRMTSWHELHDPENPENRNAGNGGDLVKHTIYLGALDYLLAHSPWSNELRVRECHAGRGCTVSPGMIPRGYCWNAYTAPSPVMLEC